MEGQKRRRKTGGDGISDQAYLQGPDKFDEVSDRGMDGWEEREMWAGSLSDVEI